MAIKPTLIIICALCFSMCSVVPGADVQLHAGWTGSNAMRLEWNTRAASKYQLQNSENLMSGSWTNMLAFPLTAVSNQIHVDVDICDCGASSNQTAMRFYRVADAEDTTNAMASLPGLTVSRWVEAATGDSLVVTNVAGDRITLRIPPVSLPFSTTISIKAFDSVPTGIPFASVFFPGVWIEPDGLMLDNPAFLSVELNESRSVTNGDFLFFADSSSTCFPVGSQNESGDLEAMLDHFSGYVGSFATEAEAEAEADAASVVSLDPCSDSYARVKGLTDWAGYFERAGNDAMAEKYLEAAKTVAAADLQAVINQSIPDPMGLFCMPNPTTDYISCLVKLCTHAELLGADDTLQEAGMERAAEAVDLWTTQLAAIDVPDEAYGRCQYYVPCLVHAMAVREIFAVPASSTDDLLASRFDEAVATGCDHCSVKWMATADVWQSWVSYAGPVTIHGRAQWSAFNIILDRDELEDECVDYNEGASQTFPDYGYPTIDADVVWLLDGDPGFATEIQDANLGIGWTGDNLDELELSCSMNFTDSAEGLTVSLEDQRTKIEKRRPFTISRDITNDSPSYKATFKIVLTPVKKAE
ncbi:MAG: hypothetical protein EOL87_13420 [Spartobacteria bacterium]|nr:hypothetical protein [Spartobacteria bacterium]